MTALEIVRLYTRNGKKEIAYVEFSGWKIKASDIMTALKEMGYSYTVDCMTYRHHACIRAEKAA